MISIENQTNPWQIVETEFDPAGQRARETVFSIGNGYLGTRGTFEEGYPNDQAVTLINGIFDDAPVVYTELANTPDWTSLDVLLDGERFNLDSGKLLEFRRTLDMRSATLLRTIVWESPAGKQSRLEFERFASLADQHVLGVRLRVTPLNWSGEIEIRAGLSAFIHNEGMLHWKPVSQGRIDPQSAYLTLRTLKSEIELCEAFHLNAGSEVGYTYWDTRGLPTLVARLHGLPDQPQQIEKLVCAYSSRESDNPRESAGQGLAQAVQAGYDSLFAAHRQAWDQEWERCNITIEGDFEADISLRYSLFQLLIAVPRRDDRVSIPAKSLTGFGYRGHVFWDTEIFVLPFFTYTSPHLARNLLLYRYHTLPGARRKARENGYQGAMYAWESATTGDETTPRWVIGPNGQDLVRIWPGDIEIHISADVAYAVMQYWKVSGDHEFMRLYGAEIVLDTARFWGSRAEWNQERGRYEISNVIGPDEYHDHVSNNAFTNIMARWNLRAAQEVLAWLQEQHPDAAQHLKQALEITPEVLEHWQDVIDRMYLGFDPQRGIFEQFEGYFKLKHINQQDYDPRSRSFQALLGIEGVQETQIIKQPDVLMFFHLLADEFSLEELRANWDYYTPLTDLSLGSSLGPAIQALLAARLGDLQAAYQHFIHAARTDLQDARGNTRDGIHIATHGGLWQAAVLGFGGLTLGPQGPQVNPALPAGWSRLVFRIQYQGRSYDFDLRPQTEQKSGEQVAHARMLRPALPIHGVIFDLDGVLTDTSELHYQAWKRLADEEGLPFTRQDNERLRGVDRRESLMRLLNGRVYPEDRLQQMMDRKNRYYVESIASVNPDSLLAGVLAFLEQVRAAGVRIAIGSASKNARAVIDGLGIAHLIDQVADGYSVERSKPAPDLFLHAASLLNVSPEHCVVFEDARAGIEAALAAGMWAVGLGPRERVGIAHLTYDSLEGLQWKSVEQALRQIFEAQTAVKH